MAADGALAGYARDGYFCEMFGMEAVRSLGLAAYFVSGYLYDPVLDGAEAGMVGAGSTHAWAPPRISWIWRSR